MLVLENSAKEGGESQKELATLHGSEEILSNVVDQLS